VSYGDSLRLPIEPVITSFRQKLQDISGGTKANFLKKFGTIHAKWHMAEMMSGGGTFNGSRIGFLSFHHEVVTVYVARFDPSITPLTNPAPSYRQTIDKNTDPLMFSHALEGWHNLVHRNPKYGPNFGNPRKNIKMKIFWQFHKFIDGNFQDWFSANNLNYDGLDHTLV